MEYFAATSDKVGDNVVVVIDKPPRYKASVALFVIVDYQTKSLLF